MTNEPEKQTAAPRQLADLSLIELKAIAFDERIQADLHAQNYQTILVEIEKRANG
jgi:hypothetical protein